MRVAEAPASIGLRQHESEEDDTRLEVCCRAKITAVWEREIITHLLLRAPGEHLLECDVDVFDDGQQHGAGDSAVPGRLEASAHSQRPTREEAGDHAVPGVLLLADALDRAVECREQAAPDAEVAAEDGRPHLDGGYCADPPLAVRGVSEALDAMPDASANGAHAARGHQLSSARGTQSRDGLPTRGSRASRRTYQNAPPKSFNMT